MNARNWGLLLTGAVLILGTAGVLANFKSHQNLGKPGVKTHPMLNSSRLVVDVPERVLDYQSEWVEVDTVTSNGLPADTSFGHRNYRAPDGFSTSLQVVLMGSDRTSLHKPQFCLEGMAWRIDPAASAETTVRIDRPYSYDLPVVKLVAARESGDRASSPRLIYVYWFVADKVTSASISGFERMWLMAKDLLRTGVLQRWAYVTCAAVCAPGQEDATFERMKPFIADAVPQLHLSAGPPLATAPAGP